MKIDMHVHTAERSACGCSSGEDLIESAIGFGLDAVFFTDHDRLAPAGRLRELNLKYSPFKIFGGIEVAVSCSDPARLEHFIVLGVDDARLEREQGCRWDYSALRRFVLEREGFIIHAHPYRYGPVEAAVFREPPDAVELRSGNILPENEPAISRAARIMGCRAVCSSDAHSASKVGMHHVVLEGFAAGEKEVISLLRRGSFSCGADARRTGEHLEEKYAGKTAGGE